MINYRVFFENALSEAYENAPFSDDETLFNIVKERTSNMEKNKTRSKKPAIIAASVAAAAALTVSAGAALNWDLNSVFSGIFSSKADEAKDVIYIDADNAPDSQITQNDDVFTDNDGNAKLVTVKNTYRNYGFDYNKYGKELDLSFDGDGFTVNYKGMMGEGKIIYVLYDVVFDEGTDYKPKEGYSEWYQVFKLDTPDGLGRSLDYKLIYSEGNTYSYWVKMTAADDLAGNILTIKGSGLWRESAGSLKCAEDEIDIERLECDFYTEIPIDMNNDVPKKTAELNEPIKVYDLVDGKLEPVDTVLYDINITPFTCTVSFCENGRVFGKAECFFIDPLTFTFSDGTELIQGAFSSETDSETDTQTIFFEFDYPVEPDDIVSVTIDGKTITLK